MANYYLDIETTGLDPQRHKIVTIQYQQLDKYTGEGNGLYALKCYNHKAYDKLETYIRQEAEEYLRLLNWVKKEMPKLRIEFNNYLKEREKNNG